MKACEFLEVLPTQEMESIKVKVGHRFLGLQPENFEKDRQDVKDLNNEKFLLVRAKYRIIVEYRNQMEKIQANEPIEESVQKEEQRCIIQ